MSRCSEIQYLVRLVEAANDIQPTRKKFAPAKAQENRITQSLKNTIDFM